MAVLLASPECHTAGSYLVGSGSTTSFGGEPVGLAGVLHYLSTGEMSVAKKYALGVSMHRRYTACAGGGPFHYVYSKKKACAVTWC